MVCISQKNINIFIKNLLKILLCAAILIHDKWKKEWIPKPEIYTLKGHTLYLVVYYSWNYKSTLHSAAVVHFSEKSKKVCLGLSRQ